MEKAVQAVIIVLTVFMVGLLVYFALEARTSENYEDRRVPYSHVSTGVLSELTPASLLYNQDIEFWSKNTLVKKQFYLDTKFGQTKESGNTFNYTISDSEDCEREFDKGNYPVQVYYQKAGIGTEKYNIYTARSCWIESVSPIKMECEQANENAPCLYSSKVSCVCLYATEA